MKSQQISELEESIGYRFRRGELLDQALTHASHARESTATPASGPTRGSDNEQLEFLGDSILGFITSEEVFHRFPLFREGELSRLKAHLVSEKHLIQVAQKLQLGRFLHLGRGEEKSGGRNKPAMLANALEAILAAVYLDSGLESARKMVLQYILGPELEKVEQNGNGLPVSDYKSALQEMLQATGRPQPSYVLVKEYGLAHSKTFIVEARLLGKDKASKPEFVGSAEGSTKKNAEQAAARQVLDFLKPLPVKTND